jgi:hypothetical protein
MVVFLYWNKTKMSEYLPNNPDTNNEQIILPDPGDMTFEQFDSEYSGVMASVAEKEKKGGLDLDESNYIPLTQAEQELMTRDWKDFSRSRGFSEEDIAEYDRWLVLSGQSLDIPNAINDPWRRRTNYPSGWSRKLYIDHIRRCIDEKTPLKPEVQASYEAVLGDLERLRTESDLPG